MIIEALNNFLKARHYPTETGQVSINFKCHTINLSIVLEHDTTYMFYINGTTTNKPINKLWNKLRNTRIDFANPTSFQQLTTLLEEIEKLQ
jgi:hypothetical protein